MRSLGRFLAVLLIVAGAWRTAAAASPDCQLAVRKTTTGNVVYYDQAQPCPVVICDSAGACAFDTLIDPTYGSVKVCLCPSSLTNYCVRAYKPDPAHPNNNFGGTAVCVSFCGSPCPDGSWTPDSGGIYSAFACTACP